MITVAVPARPMAADHPCDPVVNPVCWVADRAKDQVKDVVGAASDSAMDGLAHWVQQAVIWLVEHTVTLWIKTPSADLTKETAVGALQQWLLPISLAVAVGATLFAAGRMAITGKANPLMDVGQGLVIIVVTGALCVSLPTMLLKAGDTWSNWVIDQSLGGQTAKKFTVAMADLIGMNGINAPGGVVVPLCFIALVMSVIQSCLMLFRMAALIILAGVLPLAAAGSLAPGTRAWIKKVLAWMLALIFYKPAAAMVYATAFTMIGQAKGVENNLVALMMLALSIAALPILLKFFTWATGHAGGHGGGGMLGAAVSGAVAIGSFRGGGAAGGAGGTSAGDHARFMNTNGPSAQPSPRPPGKPTGPSGGDGASGQGPDVKPANASGAASPTGPTTGAAAPASTVKPATTAAGPAGAGLAAGVQVAQTFGQMARTSAETSGPPQKEN